MANSKPAMLLKLALVSLALAPAAGVADGAKTTTTRLRFYIHDIVTPPPGGQATAVLVARGATPLPGDPRTRFGDTFVIDDPLTEGPGAASAAVGRAQGFFMFASQTELALLLSVNMVFTAGPHNGSTVAVLARDAILDAVRELPVVGGTGGFRGVTGYGLLRTHSINTTAHNAVLLVDMYLKV
ncbi:hypothetical protein ACP70R_004249 [Stipagrostis hirtigluma subsp. patula]